MAILFSGFWGNFILFSEVAALINNESSILKGEGASNQLLLLYGRINEITSLAATWVDLEIITLSEESQTEKDKYHTLSLIYGIF